MIPYYRTISDLKKIENDISIRFLFQCFQISSFFSKNEEIFEKSSKQIFIKIKMENDEHTSIKLVIFSEDYKDILYETSILVSRLTPGIYVRGLKLKNTVIQDYIKYILKYISYNLSFEISDGLYFQNSFKTESELMKFIKNMKLSINNVNILTSGDYQLIEIVHNDESYLIYKSNYQTPWR